MTNPNPPPRRPKRRASDRSEIPVSFLPEGNPNARRAYLCAIIGLCPVLGLLMGPFALFWGYLGWRAGRNELEGRGVGHSFVSMILGALEIILNALGITLIAIGLEWI
jgi:hypothetical protein